MLLPCSKRLWIGFGALCCALFISSCENFRDNNDEFGGQWQLTQWVTFPEGSATVSTSSLSSTIGQTILATQADGYYYSVHRDLMQFTHITSSPDEFNGRFFSHFRRTADSLFLYDLVDIFGKPRPLSALKAYGVPSDGKFAIELLQDEHLVLRYKGNKLTFRKY